MSASLQTNRTSVGDPVDVVTGEVYLDRTDFTLPCAIPLQWQAYYSSRLDYSGPLGSRWTHALDCHLDFRQGFTSYVNGQGGEIPFTEAAEIGKPVSSADNRYVLEQHNDKAFSVTLPGGLRQGFLTGLTARCARLVMISDRNKQIIKFHYNNLGQLTRIEDGAGRTLQCEVDSHGRVVRVACFRVQNPGDLRVLVTYEYDDSGDLVGVVDACGNAYRYEYDEWHQMLKKTDRNGYSFNYRYSGNMCTKTWGDDGLYSSEFTYEPHKRRTTVTGFDGRQTIYQYNERNLVEREVDSYGYARTANYDQLGNPVLRVDRVGRATIRKYDERGNIIEEIQPTGRKTVFQYNEKGDLLKTIDPSGEIKTYAYDPRGNKVREVGPSGLATVHEYDSRGRCKKTTRPNSLPETHSYDEFDQLLLTRDATGAEICRYEYDLVGNVIATTFDQDRIEYSYDDLSRMTQVRYPDDTTERSTYDAEGNPTSFKDRLGHTWKYSYKARKQLIEVTNPDGGTIKYDYTLADEKCRVVDPNGNVTEYKYNLCDQITEIHRNDALVERYDRDPEGRLTAKRDPQGNELLLLTYGAGDQPEVRIVERDGRKIESKLTYDQLGRVVAIEDEVAQVSNTYHASSHIMSARCNGHGVRHNYDSQGRLLYSSFGDGVEFHVKYHGDTVVIRDPSGAWHSRRSQGTHAVEAHWANDVQEEFSLDHRGRVTRHVISHDKNGRYFSADYQYDQLGRVANWQRQGSEQLLEYDPCNRLTRFGSARGADQGRFRYDRSGNLLPSTESASIDTGNRLTGWASRRFSYDSGGRLSFETRGASVRHYRYDSSGQLTSVESNGSGLATYDYDGLRRRVSKVVNAERIIFGWEGTRLSWETHPNGRRRSYFYLGPKEQSPVIFCDTIPQPGGAPRQLIYFVHYDLTNRPILITDSAGEMAWSADWSAYGLASVDSRKGLEYNLRLPGQYYDAETGFHYNYHRYYDPEIGRYTQPDPIGLAGGLNLYAFGNGDPLFACDVLGLANT